MTNKNLGSNVKFWEAYNNKKDLKISTSCTPRNTSPLHACFTKITPSRQ